MLLTKKKGVQSRLEIDRLVFCLRLLTGLDDRHEYQSADRNFKLVD